MRAQFFYTHRWRVKSIVLWDNCHTTPADHWPLAGKHEVPSTRCPVLPIAVGNKGADIAVA